VTDKTLPFSQGATLDYLNRLYAGQFTSRESGQTVGVVAVSIIQSNSERISLTFCNTGTFDVFLGMTQAVTLTSGIRLPAGGILSVAAFEDGILPTLNWYGIGVGAGNFVYTLEVFRYLGAGLGALEAP
jgi:hypothetical protein